MHHNLTHRTRELAPWDGQLCFQCQREQTSLLLARLHAMELAMEELRNELRA